MFSETTVFIYQTMWRHTPEDSNCKLSCSGYMAWWLLAHVRGLLLLNLETSNYSWILRFWQLSSRRIKLFWSDYLLHVSPKCTQKYNAKRHCKPALSIEMFILLQVCVVVTMFSACIYFIVGLCSGYHTYCFYFILLLVSMLVTIITASS
jgi:hypothetical protein